MATLTITTTAQQDQRISAAFGHLLELPGGANAQQIKAYLTAHIRQVVHTYEREQNHRAFSPAPMDPA